MGHLLPIIATCASAGGLVIAVAGYGVSRRHARARLREEARELAAAVVAELVELNREKDVVVYTLSVTNVGRAVARDVDIAFVRWSDEVPLGIAVAEQTVATALGPGETRTVAMRLPLGAAMFDDRGTAIELAADYYDDAGVRNNRLALVLEDGLVPLPPELVRAA